jgi:hypothetical protein
VAPGGIWWRRPGIEFPRLTIQSFQERFPWVMRPLAAVDALLTPRRWAPRPFQGAAARVEALLTRDSQPLARLIRRMFGWVAALRAALLRDRPVLQRLAWVFRQQVWAAVWAFIVVMRLWPRRVPVPRAGNAIRLITAPESYPDFQSASLVVPSDVPHAEMSLPGSLTVQALHVLQDLYPVVSTHQPEAPRDPRERLRWAYPFLFRLVRTPPVWHTDLVEAQRQGRVLDLLAVGGPYAKLLERAGRREYIIDLDYLRQYPVRSGLSRLGCRIRYADRDTSVAVTGIEHEGKLVTPGDTQWPMAERVALCSLATHTTVWRHGMQYHVGGVAPFAVATYQLPSAHPLRRLLAPHMADTLSTNYHTHLTLRRTGFDVTGFSFSYDTILRYYDDGARYFDIRRLDPREDAARREIGGDLEYPHLPQAERYFDLFTSYAGEYLTLYYPDEASLAQDAAVRAWFDTLNGQVVRGLSAYMPALTRATLARLCALYMYTVSVEHEDNTMWNYGMFLPATVREDGRGESVGQVQAVVNFELLISSATNRLMNDASQVALDGQGAAIMRRFQARLAQLQHQMEHEPARYWRIMPRDLEASVSA